jgi:hypothetical protein
MSPAHEAQHEAHERALRECITVEAVMPPIPVSEWDYRATHERYDGVEGWGASESLAIRDLLQQLQEAA